MSTHQLNWPSVKIFLKEYVLGLIYDPRWKSPKKYLGFTELDNWTSIPSGIKDLVLRGFLDYEIRDVDEVFAKWALPRVKRFREITYTFPLDGEGKGSMDAWYQDLDKMINAFQLIIDGYDGKGSPFTTQEEFNKNEDENDRQIQEGLTLFGDNVRTMWD